MNISISKKVIEEDVVNAVNNVCDDLNEVGVPCPKIDFKVKSIKRKAYTITESTMNGEPIIRASVNDDFIIEIINLYIRCYRKLIPVISIIRGVMSMFRGFTNDITEGLTGILQKWEDDCTYGLFEINENEFYSKIVFIVKQHSDGTWSNIHRIKYGELKDKNLSNIEPVIESINEEIRNKIKAKLENDEIKPTCTSKDETKIMSKYTSIKVV